MGKARRYWWFVVAWAALIFLLSSIPGKSMPQIPALNYDKVLHGLVYSVLGGLFFVALRRASPAMTTARVVAAAALFAFIYGLGDELHQFFVPGRSADGYDVLADGIGGLLGASIAAKLPFVGSVETR